MHNHDRIYTLELKSQLMERLTAMGYHHLYTGSDGNYEFVKDITPFKIKVFSPLYSGQTSLDFNYVVYHSELADFLNSIGETDTKLFVGDPPYLMSTGFDNNTVAESIKIIRERINYIEQVLVSNSDFKRLDSIFNEPSGKLKSINEIGNNITVHFSNLNGIIKKLYFSKMSGSPQFSQILEILLEKSNSYVLYKMNDLKDEFNSNKESVYSDIEKSIARGLRILQAINKLESHT